MATGIGGKSKQNPRFLYSPDLLKKYTYRTISYGWASTPTYGFELAKDAGWIYNLLTDREWTGRHAVNLNDGTNGIFALRSSIDNGFDENGRVRYPLVVRITGNIEGITELFATCGWNVRGISEKTDKNNYLLTAKTMRLVD